MLLAVAHKKELIITIFQASGQHGHGHRGSELWADQVRRNAQARTTACTSIALRTLARRAAPLCLPY